MAHHKSAKKRIKTNLKSNIRNKHYTSMMRSSIRRVREGDEPEQLKTDLQRACALLDRLASKGIIHRNTAARRKSRLNRIVSKSLR